MGDTCAATTHNYSPVCDRVLHIAHKAIRLKTGHGDLVQRTTDHYFGLIASRVKPGPELNATRALTSALAMVHHLRGLGREKENREKFYLALKRGLPLLSDFKEDTGMSSEEFVERLNQFLLQYKKIHSTNLDFNSEMKLENYALEIEAGGIALPTLLVRLADLSLSLDEAIAGLPSRESLSDSDRQLLASKLKTVWFPFADTIGWLDVAYKLRRNGVLWDENSVEALHRKEDWLRKVYDDYVMAGVALKALMEGMLVAIAKNPEMAQYSHILRDAIIHPPRVKSPAAIVIKEEKFEREGKPQPIMDMVAVRIVFDCDAPTAQFLGRFISDHMKGLKNFAHKQMQDYIMKPKKTGYRAVHVTGYFRPGAEEVPVEVQFMDKGSYLDSICGRSSRLVYKSGADEGDGQLMDAINRILSPILAAAADVRGAMENPIPVSMRGCKQDEVTYQLLVEGTSMCVRMKRGSLAVDVAFRALKEPKMVDILTDSGGRVSFFEPCPEKVMLVNRPEAVLNPGLVSRILGDPNISLGTKRIVRRVRAGK